MSRLAGGLLAFLCGGWGGVALPAAEPTTAESAAGILWPVRGDAQPATFAGFPDGGHAAFRVADATRQMPLSDLACWGRLADAPRAGRVLLADGSELVAEVLQIRDQRMVVDSTVFGLVELPLSAVRGLLCTPPADPLQRDRLCLRISAAEGVEDCVILKSGEQVRGVIEELRVAQEGDSAGLPVIVLATRGRTLRPTLLDVLAVIFNPALVQASPPPQPPTLIGLRDGSRLSAQRIAVAGAELQLGLAGGVTLAASGAQAARAVCLLQPLGSVTYVSDLPTLGDESIPFLRIAWPPQADRNVYGGRLRSEGGIYAKGLGMRSSSRSAFRLDAAYSRFQAEVALDERAGRGGSVVFKLFCYDASGRWQAAWESPVVRGGQPPQAVSVDIQGARALALIVEFAERGDVQDDANWLNPRLIR